MSSRLYTFARCRSVLWTVEVRLTVPGCFQSMWNSLPVSCFSLLIVYQVTKPALNRLDVYSAKRFPVFMSSVVIQLIQLYFQNYLVVVMVVMVVVVVMMMMMMFHICRWQTPSPVWLSNDPWT